MSNDLPGRRRALARRWVLATTLLLAACVAVSAMLTVRGARGVALGLVLLLPLMLPLPGLVRLRRRTYAWATLCVAPYFVYGVTEVVANPAVRWMAAAILLASLALFVALVAYLRLTRPAGGAQAAPES